MAQSKLADLMETKLARHDLRLAALRERIIHLSSSTSGMDMCLLPFRTSALRQLVEAEMMLNSLLQEREGIRRDALSARGRKDALFRMAGQFQAAAERKALEEEGLESAMQLAAKASGKAGMLK